jgi:hypothetical protein
VFPEGLPETILPAGGTTVPVHVLGVTQTPDPGTGKLYVDTGGGYVEYAMSETAPNEYEAVFPSSDCATTVDYYFSADTTGGGTQFWPSSAPIQFFTTLSAVTVDVAFEDDFEADLGWTVANSGGLTDGAWDRGVPVGGGDRGDPPTDADGSGQCYLTDNVDGNSDVDGGSTTLNSPIMDATVGDPFISYWRWFDNTAGDNPNQDIFVIDVSDDGGSSWVNLEIVGPADAESAGNWFLKSYRIADFVDTTDQFRIRFTASDTDPQSVVEAAVDGVQVLSIGCGEGGIPGDLDGNGSVNVNDLLIMLGSWGPCPAPCPPSCLADLDGDCQVGVNDFLILLSNWG